MKKIYIMLGLLLFLVVILIAGVAADIAVTLELRERISVPQPTPTNTQWNMDEWARKAIALDGHNEIVPERVSYYSLLMEDASRHCSESKEVLDRLIEDALLQAPRELPNMRMGILSVYAGLTGLQDCSAFLLDIINQLNE